MLRTPAPVNRRSRGVWLPTLVAGVATPAPPFVADTFVDTNGKLLTAHTGEVAAQWAVASTYSDPLTIQGNAVVGVGAANFASCYATAVPPSANYTVTAPVVIRSVAGFAAVYARQDTVADTNYGVFLTTTQLQIQKRVAGATTVLGTTYTLTAPEALAPGQTRTIAIQVTGTTINAFLDGVQKVTATDAGIAAAGRVAIRCRDSSASTGMAIDSVVAG